MIAIAFAAGLVLPSAAMPVASAQQFEVASFAGPSGGPFGPSVSTRSVERYGRLLGLTEEQRDAVKELHEGYTAESRENSAKMREAMNALHEKARGDAGFKVFAEDMPKVMKDFGERSRKLEESFFKDMAFLLTAEQQEKWPAVERMRRRETGLRRGMISGEGVDLIEVVDDLKLPPEVSRTLAPTMDQYDLDIDRAIQDRVKVEEEMRAEGEGAGMITFNPETMEERMKAMREAGAQIRDLNERFARLIAAALPEDQQKAFADKVERLSFPQVYRSSHASREVAAASKFHDLTPDQKRVIDEIRSTYERESSELNRRWARALRKSEESGTGGGVFMTTGDGGGDMIAVAGFGGEPDDVREARQARQELDDKASQRLASLLNDEQKGRLPKKEDVRGQVSRFHASDEAGEMEAEIVIIEDGEPVEGEEGDDGPP